MTTSPDAREEFLAHYGVPGMKWGKRKGKGGDSSSKSGGSKSKDSEKTVDLMSRKAGKAAANAPAAKTYKPASKLSDKQLREKINRIQMEAQYSKLTQPESRSKLKSGQEKINSALSYWNTASSLYNAYNSPLGKLVKDQLKSRG